MNGSQNIDLLSMLPKKEMVTFPANVIAKFIVLVCTFLFLLYSLGWLYNSNKNSQLSKLLKEKEKTFSEFQTLTAQDKGFINDIPQTYPKGFSIMLSALSQSIPNGVWLTNMTFATQGVAMSFKGEAENPDLISQFINALGKNETINGKFDLLDIDKKVAVKDATPIISESETKNVTFVLATHENTFTQPK